MATTTSNTCSILQKSIAHCEGTPVIPGVRKRIYYIAKSAILGWPKLPMDNKGRPTSAVLTGDFVLAADEKWHYIDIDPAKSGLTSDAQGEYPSQTQLNKFSGVVPNCDAEASAAAAYINNCDIAMLIPDAQNNFRLVGSEIARSESKVTQDLGQGPTGTASTTIEHNATDYVPNPFYPGKIEAEDGTFNGDGSAAA